MVEGFKIEGGRELNGIIEVSGAKNAALPIVIATLVEKGEYILNNVPNLRDIRVLFQLHEEFGLIVEKIVDNSYKINKNRFKRNEES